MFVNSFCIAKKQNRIFLGVCMSYSKVLYAVMLCCSALFSYFQVQGFYEGVHRKEHELLRLYSERIQNTTSDLMHDGHILHNIFTLYQGRLTEQRFADIARMVYKPNNFTFVSYLPQGIVKYVYPKDVFEWALDMNIFNEEDSKKVALHAKNTGKFVLTGPYTDNRTETIVALRPVFETIHGTRNFWGFIAIGLNAQKLFSDNVGLKELQAVGYEYGLSTKYDNKIHTVLKSEQLPEDSASVHEFTMGEQSWTLRIYDTSQNRAALQLSIVFFGLCAAFSTLVYYFVYRYEQKQILAKQMAYVDPLTKAYNRKIIDEFLDKPEQSRCTAFTLFYLDINDFTSINDRFGNEIGNKLLTAFAERLRNNFTKDTIIARTGHDTFALIVPHFIAEATVHSIVKRIEALSCKIFHIDTVKIEVTASIGFGHYPQDAQSMANIIAVADNRMYAWKRTVQEEKDTPE